MKWMVLAMVVAAGCATSGMSQEESQAEMQLRQLEDGQVAHLQAQYDQLTSDRTWNLCARWKNSGRMTPEEQTYGEQVCPAFYPRHAALIDEAWERKQQAETRVAIRRRNDAMASSQANAGARRRSAAAIAAGLQAGGASLQDQARPLHCTRDVVTLTPGSMTCR